MTKTAIIIVNWNAGDLLARCLQSIAALSEQDNISHVVVIDNASSDDSIILAKSVNDRVHFIELDVNVGFARANNIGIEYVVGHGGVDHIMLLNPDTEMQSGAVMRMVEVLERRSDVGIVGPKLLNVDRSIQSSVRTFPTFGVFLFLFLKFNRLFSFSSLWQRYMMIDFSYDAEKVVDQVMGAAFLIRNTVVKDIGKLDERFWIWFEEVDYCKVALDAGWKTVFTPHACVLHYGAVSFGQLMGLRRALLFLNSSIRYAGKHLGFVPQFVLFVLYPAALLLSLLAGLVHSMRNV